MNRREFIIGTSILWLWSLVPRNLFCKQVREALDSCNHEESLKNIQREDWASLNVVNHNWTTSKILFSTTGVTCDWKLFTIKFMFFEVTIWWIRYDIEKKKIIIEWELKWASMDVPMSLWDACILIDQILNMSNIWKPWDKIKISWWKWAKLVLQ